MTAEGYWDRPFLDDFIAPAGRTIREVAAHFGLLVPEAPAPPRFVSAADRLYAAAAELRGESQRYYDLVLNTYGEWSPGEMCVRVLLATDSWRELSHGVKGYEKGRKAYELSERTRSKQ